MDLMITQSSNVHIDSRIPFTNYQNENWVWDKFNRSPEVMLSTDLESAYFYIDPVYQSTGTAGVRGTKPFTQGEHYWEIIFLEPPHGTSVMVGIGTEKAELHKSDYRFVNLIGLDAESWGLSYKGTIWHGGKKIMQYCEPFYDQTTTIGCHLNMYSGTLSFYKNGENMGVAFTGLNKVNEPLFPIVSSTGTETELGLGVRSCRYSSLQEKCLHAVKRSLDFSDSVDCLPLPKLLKSYMKQL